MVVYRPTVSHLVEAMQPRAPVCLVQYVVQGEQIKVYNLRQLLLCSPSSLPCCSLGWLRLSYVCVAFGTECVVSVLIVFTYWRLVALSALCGECDVGGGRGGG